MESLRDYYALIEWLDEDCRRILLRYGDHIVCRKGCLGHCCRIHLDVFAVEAVALAVALRQMPAAIRTHIRQRAAAASSAGPCPLLADAACLMYDARLAICRTHGLPMRNTYRGRTAVGCCEKNFKDFPLLSQDACIDLDRLNRSLAAVNDRFLASCSGLQAPARRLLIREALLLDL